jgi:phosphate transport system permease protein
VTGDRPFALVTGVGLWTLLVVSAGIFGLVLWRGAGSLTLNFLLGGPSSELGAGGVGPALVGTVQCTLLMTVAVAPLGIATGLWLVDYAPRGAWLPRIIRGAVRLLAAVPSVVFGLFGLGFFVLFLGRGVDAVGRLLGSSPDLGRPSLLWASLTLAVLTLPVVIVTTEEALARVPRELREASMALGATRLQTIIHVELPHARAGILTGLILAISRGAGEVAPILFAGVVSYLPRPSLDPRSGFMHLGYHTYVLATQAHDAAAAERALFGTALLLLLFTTTLNAAAEALRARA